MVSSGAVRARFFLIVAAVVLTAVALASPSVAAPQPRSDFLWTNQFGTMSGTWAHAVAADASGVYVVGGTWDALQGETSEGGIDAFLGRYDAAGNVLWTRQFGMSCCDEADAVTVDASGVYVAGGTWGNAFLRKYDAAGNELWTRQFGMTNELARASAAAVAVDPSGVYLAGSTDGPLPGQTSAGENDAFLRKYDAAGNELWTRQFGTSSNDYAAAVAVDATGVYVAGGAGPFPGETSSYSIIPFLRKYDAAGNEVWTRQVGLYGNGAAQAVGVDASGVYVAALVGMDFYANPGFGLLEKYDAAGNVVWIRQFDTVDEGHSSRTTGVAADASGVYLVGWTEGTLTGQTSSGGEDAFLRVFQADGNEVRSYQFGTSAGDYADAVAVNASVAYVTGRTGGSFEGQTNAGGIDAFLVALPVLANPLENLEGRLRDLEEANARLTVLGQLLLLGLVGVVIANVLSFAIPRLQAWRRPKLGQEATDAPRPTESGSRRFPLQPFRSPEGPASRPARQTSAASASGRTLRLTTKERILLHLAWYARHAEAAEVPPTMTQEGISAAAWIDQRHFAQYVDPLARDGLISVRTAHVQNGRHRRRIYELTDAGRRVATRIIARAKSEVVQVWDGENVWEVRVGEIMEKMNGKVTVLDVARHLAEAGVVDFAAIEAAREDSSIGAGDSE